MSFVSHVICYDKIAENCFQINQELTPGDLVPEHGLKHYTQLEGDISKEG